MTCDDVRELGPAFVLGALEPDEMAAVREHLATCADAHEEIAQLGGVVGYLGDVVEAVEPPVALKARILAAAAADQERFVAAPAVQAVTEEPVIVPSPAPVVDLASRRDEPQRAEPRGVRPRGGDRVGEHGPTAFGRWALGLAAVLAIVVLGASTFVLQGRLDASERYARAVADVVAAAAEPGSQTAILSGGSGGPTGIAAVRADGSIVLAMRGLAPTSGTEVYEAWVIVGDGGPVPVGGFSVGTDGTGVLAVGSTMATAGATLALTREPAPGATTPTLPIVSAGVAVAPPG